jgi:hypothetical protein
MPIQVFKSMGVHEAVVLRRARRLAAGRQRFGYQIINLSGSRTTDSQHFRRLMRIHDWFAVNVLKHPSSAA